MSVLEQFKKAIFERRPASVITGDDVIESATGHSRGKGSISILEFYENPAMMLINDELAGYRGSVREDNFLRTLDGYAAQGVEFVEFRERARDRRADWQKINDDSRGQR